MEKNIGFLGKCKELAKQAKDKGESPVGSVVVLNGAIIGQAFENTKGNNDITQHAEILAIKDAIAKGNKAKLKNSTLYSTHEPCFMCSYVIRHHKISTIIYQKDVVSVGGINSEFKVLLSETNPAWGEPPAILKLSD